MKKNYLKSSLSILGTIFLIAFSIKANAQCVVNATAVASVNLTPASNLHVAMSVAYNPIKNLYYAVGGGSSNLVIETFDGTTGAQVSSSANSGHDWRGIWWNPNLSQLEGNPCSSCPSLGIRKQDINAGTGYALSTGTNINPIGQPNFQSGGCYNSVSNEYMYYDNGRIYLYSGVNGAAVSNFAVTGLPVAFGNISVYFCGYSGCAGQEIVLHDFSLNRVYLVNKANGAYIATSILPAGAPNTGNFYRVSYANNRLFLHDGASTWKSYQVIIPCVNPAAAGPITGTASVCQGQTAVMYSVGPIAGATGFNWVVPPGAVIVGNANNDTIFVDFGNNAVSGNVSVNGTQLQCSGPASNFPVVVNPLPHFLAQNNIVGPIGVCTGLLGATYSIPVLANALGYNWVLPVGATIVAGANTNSITVDFSPNAFSGYIYVNGTNNCGNGETDSLYVTVNPLQVNLTPFANVCRSDAPFTLFGGNPAGAGGVFTGPGVTNNIFDPMVAGLGTHTITYTYTNPNTGCAGDTSNTITVTAPTVTFNALAPFCLNTPALILTQGMPNGGTYSGMGIVNGYTFDPMVAGVGSHLITYTYMDNSGCFNTDTETVIVNALPIVTFNAPQAICILAPVALTGGSPIGGVYSGIGVSNGMINPQVFGAGQVTYTYTDPISGCSNSATQTLTITNLPFAPGAIVGSSTVCQGQMGVAYSIPVIANASGYNWVLPPGATIAVGANTNSITVNFSNTAVSGVITVGGINSCGDGEMSQNFDVTVDPLPIANFTYTTNAGVGTFNNTSQYATSFVWNFGDGSPNSASVSPIHVFPANIIYTVTLTATNSCGVDSISQQVVMVSGVGIGEQSQEQKISVYPNPTSDLLTILFENKHSKTLEVKLVSADGKLIFAEQNNSFTGIYNKNISLNNNARGIYFLQIISDKQVSIQKVILE